MIYKFVIERSCGGPPELLPVICGSPDEARRRAGIMLETRANAQRIIVSYGERLICEVPE